MMSQIPLFTSLSHSDLMIIPFIILGLSPTFVGFDLNFMISHSLSRSRSLLIRSSSSSAPAAAPDCSSPDNHRHPWTASTLHKNMGNL